MERTSKPTFTGDTLYVGGSGPGNYTSIQGAIDDAEDGDTVFVYDDSSPYYENVVMDKSIMLIGEDKNTTIIDGNETGDVIKVTADNVSISNFTITNSGWGDPLTGSGEAGIHVYSDYNNIYENNITRNNCKGIILDDSSNNNISKNKVISNKQGGLILLNSDNNNIYRNSIDDNSFGLYIYFSKDNEITYNNIRNFHKLFRFKWGINALFIEAPNTTWNKNYWEGLRETLFGYRYKPIIDKLPRPIFGRMLSGGVAMLPSVQFDWNPALKPYDI